MKPYEKYKDSGVQWIGRIPNHWISVPLKRYMKIVNGRDYKHIAADIGYPVIGSGGQFACATEYLYDGESLLLGRKGTVDKPMYINGKFWTVDTMFYTIPSPFVSCKYMYYQSLGFPFALYSTDTALPSMTQTALGDNPICVPPLNEQQAIATYLDYKTGQIDSVISEKEKMLEDLKAYRSAVISEAVTKGLDKNVEMKDSGIEWIGMIPKHWNINKLKYFASIYTGSTPSTAENKYWDNPTNHWYTPADFNDDDIYLKDSTRKVSEVAFLDNACRVFNKNIVFVVGIGATLGKVGISQSICSANQQINAIDFYDDIIPLFGAYYLSSLKEVMKSVANTATLAIMNQSVTGNLLFVCPPIEEQKRIIEFLEQKVAGIKETIIKIQSQISDLKSYKSSLITEAVTGKIDLRDWKK